MRIVRSGESNDLRLKNFNAYSVFARQIKNPLLIILFVATLTSALVGEHIDALVIGTMMGLSVFLGFWNEFQAERTVRDLLAKISLTATVIRNGVKEAIPAKEVRPGDIVVLYPGCIVPADIKLTGSDNLEINESVLTGESVPVLKGDKDPNLYMGTVVSSGSGQGVIIAVGKKTKLGEITLDVSTARPETEFEKGLKNFGKLLLRVVSIMAIVIFLGNWVVGRSPVNSVLFALTIAIGLTPELLPVIVTVSLSHGARKLARKKVIVKQLVSIEDLGNMEVLCTDKTGTLTEGKIQLTDFCNSEGEKDLHILEKALLCNAAIVHNSVIGDAIDSAIWNYARDNDINTTFGYTKIAEEPFDYERRAMFTVLEKNEKRIFQYKGSPAAVLAACALTDKKRSELSEYFDGLAKDGIRAIALASKPVGRKSDYDYDEAKNLSYEGYITFRDIPKKDVGAALALLKKLEVQLKIVTGDNEEVTKKICREIGAPWQNVLLGAQIETMDNDRLNEAVWKTDIFAKVTPKQKGRIIRALNTGNHTIGYLGDGVNDALALHEADVGISVDTGVDVAKDTASIVLMQKNLGIIAEGIKEGRKTFANTIKYILMGTSSNFGNMFSAAGASFLLPFLPMTPSQVLLNNFLYDVSQLSIPTDNVDDEVLVRPRGWDIRLIRNYMLFFGPISSIYDFLTFGVMYFIFAARDSLFQTGWFVESFITQTMVIFVIRTARTPFFKSRPGKLLVISMLSAVCLAILIPYTPLARYFALTPLPPAYFLILILMTLTYLVLVEVGKAFIGKRMSASVH